MEESRCDPVQWCLVVVAPDGGLMLSGCFSKASTVLVENPGVGRDEQGMDQVKLEGPGDPGALGQSLATAFSVCRTYGFKAARGKCGADTGSQSST